ncbi:tryptophan 2,3-dioxygenase [Streptosporangium sandarakinum]|uniref:Tryptophan 2,3-dioxygenase n=1 Tax=Streptosporangium sandarakinum TaxID=1260955 RepID=A0A852UQN4_9ACTN|nr:tryptophan 2,3-dioxygenase family protein [Streptosporangium sandarakinum]NYF38290.1 tryptophan 2,3-dioxygenase [Streptosporangium sandarakinum]
MPVTADQSTALTYSSYLALDEILAAQRPLTDKHDEVLFIIVHQVHELWFKELLHELARLQEELSAGDSVHALQTLRRALAVLRAVIAQIDVIETMTPTQFAAFRPELGGSSGFQSAQFREIEAVLGRRDPRTAQTFAEGSPERARIEAAMSRPSLLDSFLSYLVTQGYPVPPDLLGRDVTRPAEPSERLRAVLLAACRDGGFAARIFEQLLSLDEDVQEWRYRHVKMVERIIGHRPGTGGSSGAPYLYRTVSAPAFPDLWAVRDGL